MQQINFCKQQLWCFCLIWLLNFVAMRKVSRETIVGSEKMSPDFPRTDFTLDIVGMFQNRDQIQFHSWNGVWWYFTFRWLFVTAHLTSWQESQRNENSPCTWVGVLYPLSESHYISMYRAEYPVLPGTVWSSPILSDWNSSEEKSKEPGRYTNSIYIPYDMMLVIVYFWFIFLHIECRQTNKTRVLAIQLSVVEVKYYKPGITCKDLHEKKCLSLQSYWSVETVEKGINFPDKKHISDL